MADEPQTPLMKDVIPAELHDRGYMKDWLDKPADKETLAGVFKKLDGAETLIGRKIGIPGPDAKPEEVEKFYTTLRAAKPEDYEFEVGDSPDEEFLKELRTAAHVAGLSKKQMTDFVTKLVPGMKARQDAAAKEQEKLDKEFETLMGEVYADDAGKKKVVERVQAALKEFTPEAWKPHVAKLEKEAQAVLVGVINAVLEKYASEDDLKGSGAGGSGGASDREALQKEARELQASEAWKDFRHADHEKTVKRVNEIYNMPVFKQ